ncbi:MAG: TrmH family RNA methyltransferase [Candidatus Latescibacterota bacterium]|jgi:RNA methyltransferase, TrmH family
MHTMEEITSFQNPLVKRIRSLKYKKYRQREGLFWAEGIRNTLEAMDTGWDIDALVYAPEMLRSDLARQRIAESPLRKVAVAARVFERIAMGELPQGLGALIKLPVRTLDAISVLSDSFYVVLEDPQDRGNVGAVVRSTNAAGGAGVILVGQAVDPYDPEALRTSMGATFSTPVIPCADLAEFTTWATANALQLLGTSARAEVDFRGAHYARPLALVFGNERHGLSDAFKTHLDGVVGIPILGRASSLNLSASVAVMAYQVQGWWANDQSDN